MSDPIEVHSAVVHPWHHDQFGHMNVRHYAPMFDDAAFHAWSRFGLPLSGLLAEHGVHTVAGRTTTNYIRELVAGDLVRIYAAITRIGTKSADLKLWMRHAETGETHATFEIVEVFFDPKTRGSAPIPESVREILKKAPFVAPDAG